MVAYRHLRLRSHLLEEVHPQTDRFCDADVVQHWKNYFTDWTTGILKISPKNIDELWAGINSALFSCASQVAAGVPFHKTWLNTKTWKQVDERRELIKDWIGHILNKWVNSIANSTIRVAYGTIEEECRILGNVLKPEEANFGESTTMA